MLYIVIPPNGGYYIVCRNRASGSNVVFTRYGKVPPGMNIPIINLMNPIVFRKWNSLTKDDFPSASPRKGKNSVARFLEILNEKNICC